MKIDMNENELIEGLGDAVSNLHQLLSCFSKIKEKKRLNAELRFIKDVVIEVNTKVWSLEQRLNAEYMNSDEYANFVCNALRKAANDLRKEKIKLFANIIVNAALKENTEKEYNRKYLYLDTIDKIDEHLFRFVCLLKSRRISKGKELGKGWTGDEQELKQMGIYDEFRFNADYLLSLGLIVRLHLERHDEKEGMLVVSDEYYVTEYGVEFVNFVSEQDACQFSDAEDLPY